MIKQRRNKKSNQGNSFIIVVATISFLLVLASALLVAVALCFRLKAYDINSRDNFYYLEQAMDEIYEGVGYISMKHLNDAFDETAEVIVYYDTVKKAYVTMDNTDANQLMKTTYLSKLKNDTRLQQTGISNTLSGFLSNPYNVANPEGVQLILDGTNVVWDTTNDILTLRNIVLKREAEYSTVNTRKGGSTGTLAATTFVQTITTDLTVSVPDFEVDFAAINDSISELYDFALISDMGVEINGIGTKSDITGNVYAAADFYNKEYNKSTSTGGEDTDKSKMLDNKVNSYSDTKLASCDGVSEKSMYSGLYISGAKVSIMADKLIVPGSIAAMNCATLDVLGGIEGGSTEPANVWADGIVLGGYSRKAGVGSTTYRGSSLKMKADSHVYDDLEVNAAGSSFSLDGAYYGYNYASTDNRKYSDEFIASSTNRKYSDNVKINDGNYKTKDGEAGHLTGQAHYNSSAVVVNGEDSTLDLSKVDSMYIAGQAYVEMSKSSTKNTYKVTENADGTLTWGEVVPDDEPDDGSEKITRETYSYNDLNSDGTLNDENYTLEYEKNADGTYKLDANGKRIPKQTRIQDYRTGEGLSVKSNQLAYIPPYNVEEAADGTLYVKWSSAVTTSDYFKNIWADLSKVPVIKTVVSGSEYYFYDFSQAKDEVTMNKYMEEYAKLFDLLPGETHKKGDLANFYDITDYDAFKVNKIIVDESKIYSNSAISFKKDISDKISIIADNKSMASLLKAKDSLDASLQPNEAEESNPLLYSRKVTTGLQKEYKEMKMLLTDSSTDNEAISNAYLADEGNITPINYYFDFGKLDGMVGSGKIQAVNKMNSGYVVFLGEDDVTVTTNDPKGKVKGIVICKGDVTFDPKVTEFEGLIVSGGKIITNHSVNFFSNENVVKNVLQECDESKGSSVDRSAICSLFRHFVPSSGSSGSPDPVENYEPMKSITAVQYEDILAFENWKKNVD